MLKKLLALIVTMALLAGTLPLAAQDEPVVYGVLFYSPSCPHCHEVINNHLPGIMEEFGDQLRLLLVDISTQSGNLLARSAYDHYSIPQSDWVVPMLVVNEEVLIGSVEIPQRLPEITRAGLAAGGIAMPAFPGMREVFEAALQRQAAAEAEVGAEAGDSAATTDAAAAAADRPLAERLAADPLANALAILVLAGLAVSVVTVVVAGLTGGTVSGRLARLAVALTLGAGVLVGVTLAAQNAGDALATALAWLLLAVLAAALLAALTNRAPGWLIPLVALAGLLDAIYLAYVELTQTEAVCGAVGNCNAVQQSAYAQVFGVPVGVIGVAAYVAILLVWGVARTARARARRSADALLLLIALAGALFSVYLTFLEPFVIGATCAWCLVSALAMLALLWLTAPAGWPALREIARPGGGERMVEKAA